MEEKEEEKERTFRRNYPSCNFKRKSAVNPTYHKNLTAKKCANVPLRPSEKLPEKKEEGGGGGKGAGHRVPPRISLP